MLTESTQERTTAPSELPANVLSRAASQVRQFICGLHGHDALLHFEQGRMSLQCTSCGYETPGWDLKGVPSRAEEVRNSRHVVQMPLIRQRRVA